MKVKATLILAAFGMATVLTACGSNEEPMATYCVDVNGTVLDEDYCDPDNEFYNPSYLLWYSDDDHKYKKGKKIPSADFRKGTTTMPKASAPKSSAGKTSSSAKTSAPKATQKAPAPKAQSAPKAKTGK